MIRKHHSHTPQTNPRHRKEEPQNTNSHKTPGRKPKQSKQPSRPQNQKRLQAMLNKTRTKHRTPLNNESTTTEPPPQSGQNSKQIQFVNFFFSFDKFLTNQTWGLCCRKCFRVTLLFTYARPY